jgi:uncharacterized protein YneF (UPF0154 family)
MSIETMILTSNIIIDIIGIATGIIIGFIISEIKKTKQIKMYTFINNDGTKTVITERENKYLIREE